MIGGDSNSRFVFLARPADVKGRGGDQRQNRSAGPDGRPVALTAERPSIVGVSCFVHRTYDEVTPPLFRGNGEPSPLDCLGNFRSAGFRHTDVAAEKQQAKGRNRSRERKDKPHHGGTARPFRRTEGRENPTRSADEQLADEKRKISQRAV